MISRIHAFFRRFDVTVENDSEHELGLATAALMLEVARADTQIDGVELDAITGFLSEDFDLDEGEAKAMLAMAQSAIENATSSYPFTRELVEALSVEQRVLVIERLWRVALSDRRLDKFEEATIRKLADLLYVSHSAFIHAKLRAQASIEQD